MKTHELIRSYLPDRVIGTLGPFSTLERPWLNNQPSISCIPEGLYTVTRDTTGRFQYYAVQDVPGRTNIEFHKGVIPLHSDGCILHGSNFDSHYNLKSVESKEIIEFYGEDDFTLCIRMRTINDAY